MRTPPNKPGCTEPRRASQFQIGRHWRGVGDPYRWAETHAMRLTFAFLLLLPLTAFGEETRIAVGMKHDEAVAIVRRHGGVDITPGLAVVGPKGEHPLRGYYWSFRDYDAIIELSPRGGKVERILYWTKKDFEHSKDHRANSEQSITALKLNTKTKGVAIEKPKPKDAGPNKPTAPNPARASRLDSPHPYRGVGEPDRSAGP